MEIYTLGRWAAIFQVLEDEDSKTLTLYSEGVRIATVYALNQTDGTLLCKYLSHEEEILQFG